jgi:hypothetical protein
MRRTIMRRTIVRRTTLGICASALALCAGYAAAQTTPPPDTLKVDYFSYAGNPALDATVRLTSPGTSGGSLCAAIYVFAADQEMSECCSCYLSPDGLRTLSVNNDLTANPLLGAVVDTGSIKIVSTATNGGLCPTYPTSLTPIAGVRAWATHLQNYNLFTYNLFTETPSQDATLSSAEVTRLQDKCDGIRIDGSGKGVCTCGTGD